MFGRSTGCCEAFWFWMMALVLVGGGITFLVTPTKCISGCHTWRHKTVLVFSLGVQMAGGSMLVLAVLVAWWWARDAAARAQSRAIQRYAYSKYPSSSDTNYAIGSCVF
jgi:hypothetical protein